MEYTTIQTLSSVVARCSAPPFHCSIGTRYTPRRYPCCLIPIFGSACFSASSRTRPTGNIRHYRPALRPGGHLFRSGCTSYAVSSNRLSTGNPPALPSYRPSVSRGEESCARTPRKAGGFRASLPLP